MDRVFDLPVTLGSQIRKLLESSGFIFDFQFLLRLLGPLERRSQCWQTGIAHRVARAGYLRRTSPPSRVIL